MLRWPFCCVQVSSSNDSVAKSTSSIVNAKDKYSEMTVEQSHAGQPTDSISPKPMLRVGDIQYDTNKRRDGGFPLPPAVQATAVAQSVPFNQQSCAWRAVTATEALINPIYLDKVRDYSDVVKRFRVVKKLSNGTCAVVLLGMDGTTGRHVAIKRQEKKGRQVHHIVREAEINFHVGGHLNIAQLLEVSEGPNEVILVQEYCGGGELFDAVLPEIGCAPNTARSYIIQILDAVHYLHEHCLIVHRDIKPENVMLTPDKRTVKLIDFGLAEPIQASGGKYKRRVGTVPYMDPCLWMQTTDEPWAELDVKAIDVWATGVVLFCMLCGRFPWAEATQRSREFQRYLAGDVSHMPWNRLSAFHVTLLRHMLHPVPAQRYTALQAREDIEANWPIISAAEHRHRVRAELTVLAHGHSSLGSAAGPPHPPSNTPLDYEGGGMVVC